MADAPNFRDYFRLVRDEMLARSAKLTRTVIEREGSDANALASAMAAVGDDASAQIVASQSALYIDSASGQDLDVLLFDRYNLVRTLASPSRGQVSFSTTTPVAATVTVPLGTRLSTADGLLFVTTAAATILIATSGPVIVAVRSIEAGASQQVRPATITSIIDTFVGRPADLNVTNVLATAGAEDEESDEDFRERGRAFFTTAVKGTLEAIRVGALGVLGVKRASVFEVLNPLEAPAGAVEVVIADQFTDQLVNITPTPPTYSTQAQTLAREVQSALADVRAGGVYVRVTVAQVILVSINLVLSYRAGFDTEEVNARARAAIVNTVNSLNPGVSLTIAALINALRTVNGLTVTGSEVVSPTGTTVAATLQVLRTSSTLVRVVVG